MHKMNTRIINLKLQSSKKTPIHKRGVHSFFNERKVVYLECTQRRVPCAVFANPLGLPSASPQPPLRGGILQNPWNDVYKARRLGNHVLRALQDSVGQSLSSVQSVSQFSQFSGRCSKDSVQLSSVSQSVQFSSVSQSVSSVQFRSLARLVAGPAAVQSVQFSRYCSVQSVSCHGWFSGLCLRDKPVVAGIGP